MKTQTYTVRSYSGARKIVSGTSDYMTAQADAQSVANIERATVYLWFADRAPVAIEPKESK